MLHSLERTEELSNQLQETNLKVREKNDLLGDKINELTTLRRITVAMISTMDVDAVLRVILESVVQELQYDQAQFYLINEDGTRLSLRQGMGQEHPEGVRDTLILIGHDASPLSRSLQEKRPMIIQHEGHPMAAIPIVAKQEQDVLGILLVNNRVSNRPIDESDLRSLITYTHQAGIAIENARLYETEKRFHEELTLQVEEAKAKLLATQEQLIQKERLAAMGETATVVAHEIKNPLGSIRAAAQVMAHGLPPDDKRKRYMQLLMKEVDRLDGVAQALLGYAKPLEPRPAPMQVNTVIKEILEIMAAQLEEQKIILETSLAPELHDVDADHAQVKQVLINIFQNALYFLRNRPLRTLAIVTKNDGADVLISVQDSGGGVSEKALPHIFEPFFTTRPQGTGLGLAICKRLIQAHGGTITVDNAPGIGATFIVRLPKVFAGAASAT